MFRYAVSGFSVATRLGWRPIRIVALVALAAAPAIGQVSEAWVARHDGPGGREDYAQGLAVDQLGNVYVTGGVQNDFDDRGGKQDYSTVKYDSNGNELWVADYTYETDLDLPSDDSAQAIVVDGQGNVYVTGGSLRYDPEDWSGTQVNYDVATIKYDAYGNELWVRRWNGTGDWYDRGTDIAVDSAGSVYVAIRSDWEGKPYIGPWETVTIKYDTDGNLLWTMRERDITGQSPRLLLDAQANVYIASSGGSGAAVVKYDTNGNRLWSSVGPAGSSADQLALDGQGNAYVTGSMAGDIFTAKYDSASGNRLWTATFGGDASGGDWGSGVGIDRNGNVFVSGVATWIGASEDWTILKYGPTGSFIWGRRYNGPTSRNDYAMALAVDGAGAVYVTGFIGVAVGPLGGPFDYLTIKADSDGNLLWEMTYDYGVEGRDTPWYITLDNAGNVYVTGVSAQFTPAADYDYCTIKYSQGGVPPCPGDVDGDGDVDLTDLATLLSNFGTPGGATPEMGDLDGDEDVDLSDLATLLANFGTVCP